MSGITNQQHIRNWKYNLLSDLQSAINLTDWDRSFVFENNSEYYFDSNAWNLAVDWDLFLDTWLGWLTRWIKKIPENVISDVTVDTLLAVWKGVVRNKDTQVYEEPFNKTQVVWLKIWDNKVLTKWKVEASSRWLTENEYYFDNLWNLTTTRTSVYAWEYHADWFFTLDIQLENWASMWGFKSTDLIHWEVVSNIVAWLDFRWAETIFHNGDYFLYGYSQDMTTDGLILQRISWIDYSVQRTKKISTVWADLSAKAIASDWSYLYLAWTKTSVWQSWVTKVDNFWNVVETQFYEISGVDVSDVFSLKYSNNLLILTWFSNWECVVLKLNTADLSIGYQRQYVNVDFYDSVSYNVAWTDYIALVWRFDWWMCNITVVDWAFNTVWLTNFWFNGYVKSIKVYNDLWVNRLIVTWTHNWYAMCAVFNTDWAFFAPMVYDNLAPTVDMNNITQISATEFIITWRHPNNTAWWYARVTISWVSILSMHFDQSLTASASQTTIFWCSNDWTHLFCSWVGSSSNFEFFVYNIIDLTYVWSRQTADWIFVADRLNYDATGSDSTRTSPWITSNTVVSGNWWLVFISSDLPTTLYEEFILTSVTPSFREAIHYTSLAIPTADYDAVDTALIWRFFNVWDIITFGTLKYICTDNSVWAAVRESFATPATKYATVKVTCSWDTWLVPWDFFTWQDIDWVTTTAGDIILYYNPLAWYETEAWIWIAWATPSSAVRASNMLAWSDANWFIISVEEWTINANKIFHTMWNTTAIVWTDNIDFEEVMELKNLSDTNIDNIYTGWYMPTMLELADMYNELVVNFWNVAWFQYDWYRSSEESSDSNALAYRMDWGWPTVGSKNNVMNVRPVRTFTSLTPYAIWDVWPSWGWIFHINGNSYHEAAPTDLPSQVYWSTNSVLVWTTSGYFDWPANTALIAVNSPINGWLDCINFIVWLKDNDFLRYNAASWKWENEFVTFDETIVTLTAGSQTLDRTMWNVFVMDCWNSSYSVMLWIPNDNEKVVIINDTYYTNIWQILLETPADWQIDYIFPKQGRTYYWKNWNWIWAWANESNTSIYWAWNRSQVTWNWATWVWPQCESRNTESTAFWYRAKAFWQYWTALGAWNRADWFGTVILWAYTEDKNNAYWITIWYKSHNRAWEGGIFRGNDNDFSDNRYWCAINERHREVNSAAQTEIFLRGNTAGNSSLSIVFPECVVWFDAIAIAKNATGTLCKIWKLEWAFTKNASNIARIVWWAINKTVVAFDAWTETRDVNPTVNWLNWILYMYVTWTAEPIRWRVEAKMPQIIPW